MADKFKTSNHQRQENVDEPVQKRQKPDECDNTDSNTMETKKITSIYYDCLERIFDFLDLNSLLMVAQTCKRLQIAAAAKFGNEFGRNRIWLYPSDPKSKGNVYQDQVHNLKFCSAFLRCFGSKILDIFVVGNQKVVDQYFNEYCANTLTSIKYLHKSPFSNEAFKKPFKNVEKVEITLCHLKNQLKDFVNWFPNLHHLKILFCRVDETSQMNASLPHLEHLDLHNEDPYKFHTEVAANLLQANQQLQSLKIWWESELSLSTVLDTIGANSLITKLEVVGNYFHSVVNVNTDELNSFVAEHPLVEELILEDHGMAAVEAITFFRQMKSFK